MTKRQSIVLAENWRQHRRREGRESMTKRQSIVLAEKSIKLEEKNYNRRIKVAIKKLKETGYAFSSPKEYADEIGRRTTLVPMLGVDFWQKAACTLIDSIIKHENNLIQFEKELDQELKKEIKIKLKRL